MPGAELRVGKGLGIVEVCKRCIHEPTHSTRVLCVHSQVYGTEKITRSQRDHQASIASMISLPLLVGFQCSNAFPPERPANPKGRTADTFAEREDLHFFRARTRFASVGSSEDSSRDAKQEYEGLLGLFRCFVDRRCADQANKK